MERYHIFKLGLAILFYAVYCIRPLMVNGLKINDAGGSINNKTNNYIDDDLVFYQGVQGTPGVDFPVLSHIPRTTFSCRELDSGYYADLDTDCQVFHICEEGKKISFLCPNGTIFQQSELICEWWFKVNCTNSPSLYQESAEQLREDNARRKSSRRVTSNHGAIMRTEEHSSVSAVQNGRNYNGGQRASKRTFVENGRRENRINNHATNYNSNTRNNNRGSTNNQNRVLSTDNQNTVLSDIFRASGSNYYREPFNGRTSTVSPNFNSHQSSQTRKNKLQNTNLNNERSPNHNYNFVETTPVTKTKNQYGEKESFIVEEIIKNTRVQQESKLRNQQEDNKPVTLAANFNKFNKDFKSSSNNSFPKPSPFNSNIKETQPRPFVPNNRNNHNFGSDNVQNSQPRNTENRGQKNIHYIAEKNETTQNNPAYKFNFNSEPTVSYNNIKVQTTSDRSSNQNNSLYKEFKFNSEVKKPTPFSLSSNFQSEKTQLKEQISRFHPVSQNTDTDNQNLNDRKEQTFNFKSEVNKPFTSDTNSGFQNSKPTLDQENNKTIVRNQNYETQQQNLTNSQNQVNFKDATTKPTDFNTDSGFENNQEQFTIDRVTQDPIVNATSNTNFTEDISKKNYDNKKKPLINSQFPSQNQEFAFSTEGRKFTDSFQDQSKNLSSSSGNNIATNKNLIVEGKDGTVKQKSTVALTRNDIVNKQLEPNDSDESQIPQETASFYKNSFNKLDQNYKSTSPNPHPNHRETYEEIKEPKYYTNKILQAISSVTPQYLTTQPFNNGKPFIGSQVGTTLRAQTTTVAPATTESLFTTERTTYISPEDKTESTTVTNSPSTELYTSAAPTSKFLQPVALSTLSTFTSNTPQNNKITSLSSTSSRYDINSTNKPATETATKKILDHATVYGKFIKSSTPPSSGKLSISLSKTLLNGNFNGVTPTPFSTHGIFGTAKNNTPKASAEILATSDSLNSGHPQVQFFGKVQSNRKIPGVETKFNANPLSISSSTSKTFTSNFNSFSNSFGPKISSTNAPKTTPTNFNSFGSTLKPAISSTSSGFNPFSATVNSGISTASISRTTSKTPSPTISSTSSANFNNFATTFNARFNNIISVPKTTPTFNSPKPTVSSLNSFTSTPPPFLSTLVTSQPSVSGFYVTKNYGTTTTKSDILKPRPFQLPPEPDLAGRPIFTDSSVSNYITPTFPTYKISSASPFTVPPTSEPTQPTPFTTARSTLPSTFENVDSMINALVEMANQSDHSGENPRPGLVIPPSAGPQTLHTLAVYFANALDGIGSDKDEEEAEEEEADEENMTKIELEKKKLTELLTQMTMNRYNELFSNEKEDEDDKATTITSRNKEDEDNDLEGQNTKNPAQTPKVRQLAKVFTQALSSYLDDPETFRKVLKEVRPTEPPSLDNEDTTDLGEDELLNFSDADAKSSYPPIFPTPPSARPTWGYLIAYNNNSHNLDVKNSINSDSENLQGADSQSLVSQLNKLQTDQNKAFTTRSPTPLPEDHWTTSPDVTKLWTTAFAFDPASINESFGTTEIIPTTTIKENEFASPSEGSHHEIHYELRALPKLSLNSTQVHGILIDFMNMTKSDHSNNRLQRILKKLNTTEEEFLSKMKEIESNPLTRRLILLLISECGNSNKTDQVETQAVPIHTLINRTLKIKNQEILETSSSVNSFVSTTQSSVALPLRSPSDLKETIDPSLDEDSQDARALQLLNSLYTIAARFGK